MRAGTFVALLGASLLLGCQLVLGFEDLHLEDSTGGASTGGDSGSSGGDSAAGRGGDAGEDTGSGGATGGSATGGRGGASSDEPCPALEDPIATGTTLIKLQRTDGSCFFMDEHEVTNDQYSSWADSATDVSHSTECSWNDQLVDQDCIDGSTRIQQGADYPVVCVDQCDAQEYCASVGKELCHSDRVWAADASRDDWYSACSNQGETTYPQGDRPDEEVCNVQETGEGASWEVDVGSQCVNEQGVRDLIGNVWEWVGGSTACSRTRDAGDECMARGASFAEQVERSTCDERFSPLRGDTADNLGFRCCWYP